MRRRERPVGSASNPPIVDPRWTGPIRTRDERAPYWLNTVTGELCTTAPPSYPDAPGGLLCDEPGLGKTVTALALTLAWSRGARVSSPGVSRARTCEKTGGWYLRLGRGSGTGTGTRRRGCGSAPRTAPQTGKWAPRGTRRNGGGVSGRGRARPWDTSPPWNARRSSASIPPRNGGRAARRSCATARWTGAEIFLRRRRRGSVRGSEAPTSATRRKNQNRDRRRT